VPDRPASSVRHARGLLDTSVVASTALPAGLPLYTRNPADFAGLEELLEIVGV
jgi:predicted nucleic acid-binding protein